jgi:hypothetical protein
MMNTSLDMKLFVLINGFIVLTSTIATAVTTEGFHCYYFERIPLYIATATEIFLSSHFSVS